MGELHIYEVDGMDEYLPKISYYGNKGRIQSFLNGMSAALFVSVELEVIDSQKKNCWLKIFNEARKLTLLDNKHDLIIKKMNWYVRKLVELVAGDYEWLNTLYWVDIDTRCKEITLKISDDNKTFEITYQSNEFDKFKYVDNFLQRDYSDKILTYIYNLSELYNLYICGNKKEDLFNGILGYYPVVRCSIQGEKSCAPRYIDWT